MIIDDLKRKTEIKIDLHRLIGDQVEKGVHEAIQRWFDDMYTVVPLTPQDLSALEEKIETCVMGAIGEYVEF